MATNWRKMYNQWEAAVSPTLEQFAASDAFRDVVAVGTQISRAVMNETEKASRQWLHLWNLPAAGDIRGLRRQISSLDREVQSLRRALDVAQRQNGSVAEAPEAAAALTVLDGDGATALAPAAPGPTVPLAEAR